MTLELFWSVTLTTSLSDIALTSFSAPATNVCFTTWANRILYPNNLHNGKQNAQGTSEINIRGVMSNPMEGPCLRMYAWITVRVRSA